MAMTLDELKQEEIEKKAEDSYENNYSGKWVDDYEAKPAYIEGYKKGYNDAQKQ